MEIEIGDDQIANGQFQLLNLPQLLPSLECLEVAVKCPNESSLDRTIVSMIESFAERLITFKFFFKSFSNQDNGQHAFSNSPGSLLACINTRILKLECLHFDIRKPIFLPESSSRGLDLLILQQLKEFRFHSRDSASILYGSLHRYATDRLRTIAIGNFDGGEENILAQFGSLPLANRFEILPKISICDYFELNNIDYEPINDLNLSFFNAFYSLITTTCSFRPHTAPERVLVLVAPRLQTRFLPS